MANKAENPLSAPSAPGAPGARAAVTVTGAAADAADAGAAADSVCDDPGAFRERQLGDPRVEKTRKRLHAALVELLDESSFDALTVTEICERANTTRITFYAHYGDKYDLAEELFGDMIARARREFYSLERDANPAKDALTGYRNLLGAILDLYYSQFEFFCHTSQSENPYLYSTLYRHLVDRVAHYIGNHDYMRSPRYSAHQVAAFICGGVWAFIDESNAEGSAPATTRVQALQLLESVVASEVFEPCA